MKTTKSQEDSFTIDIMGKGGHAAMPHQSVDPIYMGSQIVSALQSLVSRNTDPTDPAVVSVTQFHSGSAYNVIPESAQLCGTVRTFSHELRDEMETSMQRVCQSVAESLGGSAELSYVWFQ
jgi:hippurate hydrolase